MTGHSRRHEFAPLGTVLRTLPGGVDSEIMLLKVELNRSKPGLVDQVGVASPQPTTNRTIEYEPK